MPLNLNRVMFAGNLTRDPDLRAFSNESTVAKFTLASNRRVKSDGQVKDEATFVDCEAWNKDADTLSRYATKGRNLYVEGRLKLEQWQDKDGNKRSRVVIAVERFQFVDSAKAEAQAGDAGAPTPRSNPDEAPF